ncbi:ABC transporter ATP-binding protein [Candidatus Saccharibacteria bacterium]|nr:ABC transporter ATP-binding protein [Candidatus Saccharibacteria bacterium]
MSNSVDQKDKSVNYARQTLSIFWSHIKIKPARFILVMVLIPLSALMFSTAVPYFLSQAISGIANQAINVSNYLLLAALAGAIGGLFNYFGFTLIIKHEADMYKSLVDSAATILLQKDASFFSNQKIGALTGKYIEFINSYIKIQDVLIIKTLSFVIAMGTGIYIIAQSSTLLGILLLVFTVFILVEIRITMKIRTPYRNERKEIRANIFGEVADSLSNSLVVKTFAKESRELRHINEHTKKHHKLYIKDISIVMKEGTIRNIITVVFQIIVIGLSITLVKDGKIELGAAIFALTYLQRVAAQIFTLGDIVNGYDSAFLEAAPITKMLLEANQVNDKKNAPKLRIEKGSIQFENTHFKYEDGKLAIDNLNLHIKSGEKIGIVGQSGAGKTTITKLLLRFNDLNSGSIMIDNQSISEVTQTSLRGSIAYVPQEPLLFHRSLAENIGYSRDNFTIEEVIEAAKKAHAHEFIDELPNKYETIVGERGVKLSGGQRQRVAIARAILKDAPILVLDEATSALDSESEKLIQDALGKLMKNRTSIVIAHRLSTIQKMDRIIVLDKGKITEEGSHKELLLKNGTYAKLWAHQSGGFLED